MIRLAFADLRDSWAAWLSVSIAFIVTNVCLGIPMLLLGAMSQAPEDSRTTYGAIGGMNLFLCILVALSVMGAVTKLVVNARRGSVARLLLTGASPAQVTTFFMTQLSVVTLLSAVLGSCLSWVAYPWFLDLMEKAGEFKRVGPASPVLQLAMTAGICVVLALLGGFRQMSHASKVPPVEALATSKGEPAQRRSAWVHVARIGGALLATSGVIAAFPALEAMGKNPDKDYLSALFNFAFFGVALCGTAMAILTPYFVKPFATLVGLIPLPTPAWRLAINSVSARSDRSAQTLVPMIFVVGLLFGMMAMMDTAVGTMEKNTGMKDNGSGVWGLLLLGLLPLIISASGALANILMMSRQREAELAMSGVAGATPSQQVATPALESLVITLLATLLAAPMMFVPLLMLHVGFPPMGFSAVISAPWSLLAASIAIVLVIVAFATVIPCLAGLRKPPARVVAALVAQ